MLRRANPCVLLAAVALTFVADMLAGCIGQSTNQWIHQSMEPSINNQSINQQAVGCFAIYQILLGWKTCKYCHETDELPSPRPTQPKKNLVKKWHLGHFFPQQIFFRRLVLVLYRKQTANPNQLSFPPTP